MQPSLTLFSGMLENNTLLKFCSEQCKGLWFHSGDQKPFYVASYLDESSILKHPVAPLMSIIVAGIKSVEQFYLSAEKLPEISEESSETPFIVWHVRGLDSQYFAHFYISKECLPLGDVWMKHFCTADSELVSNMVAAGRVQFQSTLQKHFDQATKRYSFGTFQSFVKATLQARADKVPGPLLCGKFSIMI